MSNQPSVAERFVFRSQDNEVAGAGRSVLEAWEDAVASFNGEGVPSWLLTDKIEAWTTQGAFLRVQTFDQWQEELRLADEADSQCECERCDGLGYTLHENIITTDAGTKWARSASEGFYKETCELCDGAGRILSESQSFNGPG